MASAPSRGTTSVWLDDEYRYGRITRLLHWSMAAILAWQLGGMLVKLAIGRTPLTAFLVGTHVPLGAVLMALVLARVAWALVNLRRRPSHGTGLAGLAVRLGHGLLYLLMLVIPALALMRHYGSGRALKPFGIPIWEAAPGRDIAWMRQPAEMLHGPLGWMLLVLIVGHVVAALAHRFVLDDGVLARMLRRESSTT